MSSPATPAPAAADAPVTPDVKGPPFAEFVAMMAASMALAALAIDSMLPALPVMGEAFGVSDANHLQWIVAAFFIGNGAGQVIFGPLSDWLGRKPVLIGGIVLYLLLSLGAAMTTSLPAMIVLRSLQGIAASSTSVVARACIRDLYSGARMAKVLSTTYVVFLMVPVLAPSLGQLVLMVAPWQGIFLMLAGAATAVSTWISLRLPESSHAEFRRRPDLGHLRRTLWFVLTEPGSLVCTLAITLIIATLLSYISLVPQIFTEALRAPQYLGLVFALCAGTMGACSLLNARLVERLGPARIATTGLTAFVVIALGHVLWSAFGHETIITFTVLQAATMGAMILCTSNLGAIAMNRMGHVAGTASSVQGLTTSVGGTIIGAMVSQHWHGNIWLLPLGALICGALALVIITVWRRHLVLDT